MVVLGAGQAVTYLSASKGRSAVSGRRQDRLPLPPGRYLLLKPEINASVGAGVEHVIALVLRIMHAKMLLDVLGQWVYLEGKVAALHRIQKIEADGKLFAETARALFAQQSRGCW